jgi:hypothetical protein
LAATANVIPAQAGIQMIENLPAQAGLHVGFVCCAGYFYDWIPA